MFVDVHSSVLAVRYGTFKKDDRKEDEPWQPWPSLGWKRIVEYERTVLHVETPVHATETPTNTLHHFASNCEFKESGRLFSKPSCDASCLS